MKRIDAQIAELRQLAKANKISSTMAQAAIKQAELQRATVAGRTSAKRNGQFARAHQAVDAIPKLMSIYHDRV